MVPEDLSDDPTPQPDQDAPRDKKELPPARFSAGIGCTIAFGMMFGAGAAGYAIGYWVSDKDTVDGFAPVYSAMVGAIAGVVLGAILAGLLVFRRR